MQDMKYNRSISEYNKPNNKEAYRYTLVCFPHAGGSASFFHKWVQFFDDAKIYSVKYPGRAERIAEPCLDMITLSKSIAEDISTLQSLCNKPLVFFGHSMGALVAFETAKELERCNRHLTCLFASGSKNGQAFNFGPYQEESDNKVISGLLEMGGTDAKIIQDPLFKELVLPAVKADTKMFHDYKMETRPRVNCPIVNIYGKEDVHADIRPWEKLTDKTHEEHIVSGGHFYLIDSPPISEIKAVCNKIID